MFWFDHSRHDLPFDEPERFHRVMDAEVLALADHNEGVGAARIDDPGKAVEAIAAHIAGWLQVNLGPCGGAART